MSAKEAEVAIVGGGPCGLFTALVLGRAGIRCVVYERDAGLSNHPKAMGIVRWTLEIFRMLGIETAIKEQGMSSLDHDLTVWSRSLTEGEFGRVRFAGAESSATPCHSYHVPQTWTEQVLFDACERNGNVEVLFKHKVDEVREENEGVRISGIDAKGAAFSATAGWCVACDGAGSTVRRQLEIACDGPGDMGHFINTFFRAEYGKLIDGRPALLYQAVCPDYAEFFVTVNGEDLWLMHHFLQEGESPADYPQERLEQLIRTASGVPELPVDILSVDSWIMSPKVAQQFRKGRVFLSGDASARLSPAGGLGMNTGIQSAWNLAWKLIAVINGYAGEGLLDTYHEERHGAAVERMQGGNENAREVMDIMMLAVEGKFQEASERVLHSRRGGSHLGQDLGISYPEGAFIPDGTEPVPVADPINDYIPTAQPGRRAPYVRLDHEGEHRSTLNLFGSSFVMLTAGDRSPWEAAELRGAPVNFVSVGVNLDWHDPDADFESAYGVKSGGAVLVRPDGIVAARWLEAPENPAAALGDTLRTVLSCD